MNRAERYRAEIGSTVIRAVEAARKHTRLNGQLVATIQIPLIPNGSGPPIIDTTKLLNEVRLKEAIARKEGAQ